MTVPGIHGYQIMTEECEPKDLSMKSWKKLKPIPPPLNLEVGLSRNTCKESANIATSPRSPLMQKNLPFRKRAHSLSYMGDGQGHFPARVAASVEDSCSVRAQDEEVVLGSRHGAAHAWGPRRVPLVPASDPLEMARLQSQHGWSSLELSPAPSSLGSSHEELSGPSPAAPWPPAVWSCFQSGVLVKMDASAWGTAGAWQVSDELARGPWDGPRELRLEGVHEADGKGCVLLGLACLAACKAGPRREADLTVRCRADHTFYVKGKGWSALCPDSVFKTYGRICQPVELGDVLVPPPPSPDGSDRVQRFNFPPEEQPRGAPHHLPLSPPMSPTKRCKDPDRPRRPMNAFMLFAQRYRPKLIQMHPGKDNRAISVILGGAWRSLSLQVQDAYKTEASCLAEEQKRRHPDCWKRKRSHSTS